MWIFASDVAFVFLLLGSRSCTLAHHWHSRLIKKPTQNLTENRFSMLFFTLALFIVFPQFFLTIESHSLHSLQICTTTRFALIVCNWSSASALCVPFMCLHYFRWKNSPKRKTLLLHCTKNAGVVWYSVYDLSVTTFILARKKRNCRSWSNNSFWV